MASPINPTPILRGKILEDFLKKLDEPPSKERLEMFKRAERADVSEF